MLVTLLLCSLLLQDVDEWIRKLGDSDADARDKATQALIKAGESAVPAVKKAAESKDLEVAARAKAILFKIDPPAHLKAWSEATKATRKKLAEHRVRWSLENVSAKSVLEVLCADMKVGILLPKGGTVNVQADDVPADKVLEQIASQLKATVSIFHGVVIISKDAWPSEDLPDRASDKLYYDREAKEMKATFDKLSDHKVHYNFQQASVRSVLKILLMEAKVDLILDSQVNGVVNVYGRKVPAHVMLRMFCRQVGADWHIDAKGSVVVEREK